MESEMKSPFRYAHAELVSNSVGSDLWSNALPIRQRRGPFGVSMRVLEECNKLSGTLTIQVVCPKYKHNIYVLAIRVLMWQLHCAGTRKGEQVVYWNIGDMGQSHGLWTVQVLYPASMILQCILGCLVASSNTLWVPTSLWTDWEAPVHVSCCFFK